LVDPDLLHSWIIEVALKWPVTCEDVHDGTNGVNRVIKHRKCARQAPVGVGGNDVLGDFLDEFALLQIEAGRSELLPCAGNGSNGERVSQLPKGSTDGALGVPGVYTYDFYDGWAPNYMFWIANMRNSIGRFYETQAARDASNYVLELNVERQWHRPNTPLPSVVWSIRNNLNLQQSARIIALKEVADNRNEYLHNFYTKSARSVAKARAASCGWRVPPRTACCPPSPPGWKSTSTEARGSASGVMAARPTT
jgi:hypothetical protein